MLSAPQLLDQRDQGLRHASGDSFVYRGPPSGRQRGSEARPRPVSRRLAAGSAAREAVGDGSSGRCTQVTWISLRARSGLLDQHGRGGAAPYRVGSARSRSGAVVLLVE
jgi:hypothetical protein